MIIGSIDIADRIYFSIGHASSYARACTDPDQQTYALSSAALMTRERDKLLTMIATDSDDKICWALRSIVGMMKGLIDIGSDWQDNRPAEWSFVSETTKMAYVIEINSRPQSGDRF